MKRSHLVSFCLIVFFLYPITGISRNERASRRIRLEPVRSLILQKASGQIDQVVALHNGKLIVRDSDFINEENQAVEIFGKRGKFRRKIGGFGRIAGTYYRLMDIGVSGNGTIWVVDLLSRLTMFDRTGQVLGTFLIQGPGYQVNDLVFDEPRGVFYLSGCLPEHTYLNEGCQLIHQYSLNEVQYRSSFLRTDPEAMKNNFLPLEAYRMDIDELGIIYFIDAPIRKVFRIDPKTGEVRSFPWMSNIVEPVSPLQRTQDRQVLTDAYYNAFLVDRILIAGANIVLSVRRPNKQGFILQVLDKNGRQVARDLESPGQLVGKTTEGNLFFAMKKSEQFEVTEYKIMSR